jgi:hypothetical protein
VPAQQRARGDQEDRPPLAGQQPGQHCQHDPVRRREPRPADLPPHHHQLVAEHRDLRVLLIRRRTETGQTQQPPNKHETRRPHHHDRRSCHPASPQVTAPSLRWHPSGAGHASIVRADATDLPDILPAHYRGQVVLVLTSPPYGRTMHGRVEHRRGPLTRFHNSYGPPDPGNLAHRSRIGLLDGLTQVLTGCRALLRPDGLIVITARPWRRNGLLVDLPGQIIDAAITAGLQPVDRCIALLAAVRDDGRLQPRHSFWQLAVTRQARRRGNPLHVIAHEDVLTFARVLTWLGSGETERSSA